MMMRPNLPRVASILSSAILLCTAGCGGGAATPGATATGGTTSGSGGLGGAGGTGGGTGGDTPQPPPSSLDAYTMSYRSGVRVPAANTAMAYDDFVSQVAQLDPIEAKRCPVSHDARFKLASDTLGGINWTHPVEILKDRSLPQLYRGKIVARGAVPGTGDAAGASSDKAPTIERPDLIGYQDSTAIFLSQRHGLLAVKTDGARPVLSCALKLPGTPRYFFYHGKELLLLVNGLNVSEAAVMRFGVTANGFDFIDAVNLSHQQIQDARLFDSTLVVYSNLYDPTPPPTTTTTTTPAAGNGSASGGAVASPAVDGRIAPGGGSYYGVPIGVKVTAIKWASPLAVAWQEELGNDRQTDPFAGQNLMDVVPTLTVGQVVSTYRNYKSFISASDRYFVVSRDVNKTVFTGTQTQNYSVCTASHQGPERSVTYCTPKYEQRPNPDYKDPVTTKGDYACNGKSLLDCIQEAAPTVSKYIYVRVGDTCNTYKYSDWICDRSETRSYSYPVYRYDSSTQFVVYRYTDGDFVKLDEQLFQMASPGTTSGSVPALTFTGKPLEVTGTIDSKGDLQFQHGHFYVLTNQGQQLHTLLLAGNSIAELGLQNTPRQGGSYSYSGGHSTLFSDDRMMISRAYYDPAQPKNISTWSDVLMLDLTAPSFPTAVNQFVMPGSSDQLILSSSGVLGPGTVAFTSGNVSRNLQKLTLFNQSDAHELDNLLLGTEYNADFVQTWFGTADDQRIRLDDGSQRLFMPYGGYHHTPTEVFNPVAHRLNITAVGVGTGLASEMTFDLVEDIVRTVSLDSSPTAGRALAFGDSSVYAMNQGAQGWTLDTIEEFATPIAVYRLSNEDVHARIDRIGAHCQISTFRGTVHAFDPARLAAGEKVACGETGSPIAVAQTIVFSESSTGWRLSTDGLTITTMTADEVKEALTHVRNDIYCVLDPTKADGTPVPYLDAVPPSVQCYRPNTSGIGDPVPTDGP